MLGAGSAAPAPLGASPPRPTSAHGATVRATAWGVLAVLAVGLAGGFAGPSIWVLAAAAGASFLVLGWRDGREGPPADEDRFAPMLQAAFLVVLCAAAWDARDSRLPAFVGLPEAAGMALIAVGVALRRSAVNALGRHFTVRIRVLPDHRLVRSGPYRVVRHPNYAGLALVALGTAVALRSPLAALAIAVVWLPAILRRIGQEERLLARRLGDEYECYARRTWRLLPGVY